MKSAQEDAAGRGPNPLFRRVTSLSATKSRNGRHYEISRTLMYRSPKTESRLWTLSIALSALCLHCSSDDGGGTADGLTSAGGDTSTAGATSSGGALAAGGTSTSGNGGSTNASGGRTSG